MTAYLDMWKKVKAMNQDEIKSWITRISPIEGHFVDFDGLKVVDIDLSEALECYKAIRSQKTHRI